MCEAFSHSWNDKNFFYYKHKKITICSSGDKISFIMNIKTTIFIFHTFFCLIFFFPLPSKGFFHPCRKKKKRKKSLKKDKTFWIFTNIYRIYLYIYHSVQTRHRQKWQWHTFNFRFNFRFYGRRSFKKKKNQPEFYFYFYFYPPWVMRKESGSF